MATTEGSRVFLDTNVLVYAAISQAPLHRESRMAIRRQQEAGTRLWISRQVLREYLATLSRPQTFSNPQPADVLIQDVRHFEEWFSVADDGPAVTAKLLEIIGGFAVGGKQVHDANIVATMITNDIRVILTHNTDDYARFSGLISVLPITPDQRTRVD